MSIRMKVALFCISSLAFIGCDRVTKDLAKEHLINRGTISYFHDTFRLEYAENTGAALNLGDDLSRTASFWLLSIIPLTFLLLLCIYILNNSGKFAPIKMFSFALVFSGGIGNIIDRLLYDRHVTDFMNMGIQGFRTGIFNFADVCVTAGVIGLILFRNNSPALRNN